jgi:hypothetical protein
MRTDLDVRLLDKKFKHCITVFHTLKVQYRVSIILVQKLLTEIKTKLQSVNWKNMLDEINGRL